MFSISQRQSFINLVTDRENTRGCKKSWIKVLNYKAEDSKHPVMILGRFYIHNMYYV